MLILSKISKPTWPPFVRPFEASAMRAWESVLDGTSISVPPFEIL